MVWMRWVRWMWRMGRSKWRSSTVPSTMRPAPAAPCTCPWTLLVRGFSVVVVIVGIVVLASEERMIRALLLKVGDEVPEGS